LTVGLGLNHAVLCFTVVHSDVHTHEHFSQLTVGLGLRLLLYVFATLFLCCLLFLC